jgi:hypothetical protein
MRFIKLYEDFQDAKFTFEDIERCFKKGLPIFASTIKNVTNHKLEQELKVVEIDNETGEIAVNFGDTNDIYYVDLDNVERLGTNE